MKKPVGRPKVPESRRRGGHTIMLTSFEHERLQYLSRDYKSISQYIREVCKL